MLRKMAKLAAVTALAAAATAPMTVPSAHAATTQAAHSASAFARPASCHTTEIMLHGTGKPTTKCLDVYGSVAPNTGTLTPDTATPACNDPTIDDQKFLNIFINGPMVLPHGPPGLVLCVYGEGDLPLTPGLIGGVNWNDVASSWWAGCSGGIFYQDILGGILPDPHETFQGGPDGHQPFGNFDGQNGALPNDSLSEIHINNNC